MRNPLSIEPFLEFLDKNPQRTFMNWDPYQCAYAQYLKTMLGFESPCVGSQIWSDNSKSYKLPPEMKQAHMRAETYGELAALIRDGIEWAKHSN